MVSALHHTMAGKKNLPYDSEVEWIYGINGAYIDTLFAPLYVTDNLYVELDYQKIGNIGTDFLFGADDGSCSVACSPTGNEIYFKAFNTGPAPNYYFDIFGWHDVVLSYENKMVSVLDNGVNLPIHNNESASAQTTNPLTKSIWIFKRNNGSGLVSRYPYRMKRFRIVRDNRDVLDLIPVRVESEGMTYDRVSRQIFRNQGTGALVYGNDIKEDL